MELRELVEAKTVRSASDQQISYKCSPRETLAIGQEVLLQNPTAQKLDSRWTGPRVVTEIKSPLTVTINRGGTTRVVHVNRIRPLVGIKDSDTGVHDQFGSWNPPLFEHFDDEGLPNVSTSPAAAQGYSAGASAAAAPPTVTRSGRVVKPVVRYGQDE